MNIHPLFVHFPIGILVLYTALEIFRFSFITNRHSYFEIKTILIIIGTITAYLSASTGDMAEELIKITDPAKIPLVEIHSLYAGLTITIFSLLASAYLIEWCKRNNILEIITKIKVLYQMVTIILKLSPLLAFIGLVTITITGAFGAAIVYGQNVDPVVNFIYRMFSGL